MQELKWIKHEKTPYHWLTQWNQSITLIEVITITCNIQLNSSGGLGVYTTTIKTSVGQNGLIPINFLNESMSVPNPSKFRTFKAAEHYIMSTVEVLIDNLMESLRSEVYALSNKIHNIWIKEHEEERNLEILGEMT